MYRTYWGRYIFSALFSKNPRKNLFSALFSRSERQKTKVISYRDLVILCTWIAQCMRCGKSGGVIFRPQGEIFRDKMRPDVRAFAREFPPETARVHRGDTEERSGGVRLCCARSALSIGETRRAKIGARCVQKIARRALMRERPLAPLMTRRRVLT